MKQNDSMKSQKPTINLLYLFPVLFLIPILLLLLQPNGGHIDDINGAEDTSLAVITMEQIQSGNWNATALLSSESRMGMQSDVRFVKPLLDEYDYNQLKCSAKKISGVKAIHATYSHSNTLVLECDVTLVAGNMELMLFVDNVYHSHIPINDHTLIRLDDISDKLVTVIMAAESANMKVQIKRSYR